jgi:hypothetical protein
MADTNNETSAGESEKLERDAWVIVSWTEKIEKQYGKGKTSLTSLSPRYSPAPVPSLSPHLGSHSHPNPPSPLYLLLFPTSHSRMTSTKKTTNDLLPPARPRSSELAGGTPPSGVRPRSPPGGAQPRFPPSNGGDMRSRSDLNSTTTTTMRGWRP